MKESMDKEEFKIQVTLMLTLIQNKSMNDRSEPIKLTLKGYDFGKIVGVPLIDSSVFTASKEKMSFRNEAKSQYRILMKINFELSRITSKAPFSDADNSQEALSCSLTQSHSLSVSVTLTPPIAL